MKPDVVLGLSGGVDSAVAARLLMENYTVTGVYLSIGPEGENGKADAQAVAEILGIGFQTVDIAEALEKHVKAPFAADYLSGRTPLPCARCNPLVKFPALLAVADEIGAEYVATGHYARIEKVEGHALLQRGRPANDQSYLLSRLPQTILQRVIFPLGNYEKASVRALAADLGIPVAEKPDSMEICFIPGDDYAGWLEGRGETPPPGDFISPVGQVLGRHGGIHRYTLGQGRGLGVSGPHRYYVSAIDPTANTVTLSDGSDLGRTKIFCTRPNWIAMDGLASPMEVAVRFRHSKDETPCTIHPGEDGVLVEAHSPVRAPTPGQLAVFYDGDTVVGSAWIERGEV